MKAVKTSRGNLYFEFNHILPKIVNEEPQYGSYAIVENSKKQNQYVVNMMSAGTYCLVKEDGPRGEIVGQARTNVHPYDVHNFNKEKGRKVALGRVMKSMYLTKEERADIWDAYLNR